MTIELYNFVLGLIHGAVLILALGALGWAWLRAGQGT